MSGLEPWAAGVVGTVLAVLILIMVIGNLFVILAILLERDLQRPQYYLILSLAVADLMVGVVVSPLASVYEVIDPKSLHSQNLYAWSHGGKFGRN